MVQFFFYLSIYLSFFLFFTISCTFARVSHPSHGAGKKEDKACALLN